jgi:hypothetical protein
MAELKALYRNGVRLLAADILGLDLDKIGQARIADRWARVNYMTKAWNMNAVLARMPPVLRVDLICAYGLNNGRPDETVRSAAARERFRVELAVYVAHRKLGRIPITELLKYGVKQAVVDLLGRYPLNTMGEAAALDDLTVVPGMGVARARTVNTVLVALGLRAESAKATA